MGSQNTYWFLKEIEKKENVKATHTYNKYDTGDEEEENIKHLVKLKNWILFHDLSICFSVFL